MKATTECTEGTKYCFLPPRTPSLCGEQLARDTLGTPVCVNPLKSDCDRSAVASKALRVLRGRFLVEYEAGSE